MIESQYQAAVQKRLPSHIYKWTIQDKQQGGIPDAFYRNLQSKSGRPLWSEYKYVKKLPKRDDTYVIPGLSPLQQIWLRQAIDAGEQACVIIGVEEVRSATNGACGVILTKPDEWVNGLRAAEMRERASYGDYITLADSIVDLTI